MGIAYFNEVRTRSFFANIVSKRDNGAEIELNIRGAHYHDPGRYSGPPEDCYESESETTIRECTVLRFRQGTNKVWCTKVDFYEFSQAEQDRFLEAVMQEWEFE